jgi:hypothetical protein
MYYKFVAPYKKISIYYLWCLKTLNIFPIELVQYMIELHWNTITIDKDILTCGDNYLSIGKNNYLYTYGSYNHPSSNTILGNQYEMAHLDNIDFIRTGHCYHIIVTQNGVYGVGLNSYGQLGLRHNIGIFDYPRKININNVSIVSCGYSKLYVCGDNSSGQLGLKSNIKYSTYVQKVDVQSVIDISAGHFHSAILCKDGVYVCGSNFSGQLGLPLINNQYNYFVKLNTSVIYNIKCGPNYTILDTQTGLYKCYNGTIKKFSLFNKVSYMFCADAFVLFIIDNTLYLYGKNIGFDTPLLGIANNSFMKININDVLHIDGSDSYVLIFTKQYVYGIGYANNLKTYLTCVKKHIDQFL